MLIYTMNDRVCHYLHQKSSFSEVRGLWAKRKEASSSQKNEIVGDVQAWLIFKEEGSDKRTKKMLKRLRKELWG